MLHCGRYEAEHKAFEEERSSWQQELEVARQEVLEQNDRLTLLSQQLAGTKASCGGFHTGRTNLRFMIWRVALIHANNVQHKGG